MNSIKIPIPPIIILFLGFTGLLISILAGITNTPYWFISSPVLLYITFCGVISDYDGTTQLLYPSFIEMGKNRRRNKFSKAVRLIEEALDSTSDEIDKKHLVERRDEILRMWNMINQQETNQKVLKASKYASKVIRKELE